MRGFDVKIKRIGMPAFRRRVIAANGARAIGMVLRELNAASSGHMGATARPIGGQR